MPYPQLVMQALELAAQWHEGQWRKHPAERIPYIAHPAGVGYLLQAAGYDEETVAAGILHDVIEDCGISRDALALATTPRIAELVSYVSETKHRTWQERKAAYRALLMTAPVEALAVACADHLHNLHSILRTAQTTDDVWSIFHVGREEKMEHERAVLAIIQPKLASPLTTAYATAIAEIDLLPPSV